MDEPIVERRTDARFPADCVPARATLRPGWVVLVIDWSAGGALVQAARPLRPGSRVHLKVTMERHTLAIAAHVVRCAVWALGDDGVTYRGALKFEERCESLWDAPPRTDKRGRSRSVAL